MALSRDQNQSPRWPTRERVLEEKAESGYDSKVSGSGRSEKQKRTAERRIPRIKAIPSHRCFYVDIKSAFRIIP